VLPSTTAAWDAGTLVGLDALGGHDAQAAESLAEGSAAGLAAGTAWVPGDSSSGSLASAKVK
jgi:hypothetical protein